MKNKTCIICGKPYDKESEFTYPDKKILVYWHSDWKTGCSAEYRKTIKDNTPSQ